MRMRDEWTSAAVRDAEASHSRWSMRSTGEDVERILLPVGIDPLPRGGGLQPPPLPSPPSAQTVDADDVDRLGSLAPIPMPPLPAPRADASQAQSFIRAAHAEQARATDADARARAAERAVLEQLAARAEAAIERNRGRAQSAPRASARQRDLSERSAERFARTQAERADDLARRTDEAKLAVSRDVAAAAATARSAAERWGVSGSGGDGAESEAESDVSLREALLRSQLESSRLRRQLAEREACLLQYKETVQAEVGVLEQRLEGLQTERTRESRWQHRQLRALQRSLLAQAPPQSAHRGRASRHARAAEAIEHGYDDDDDDDSAVGDALPAGTLSAESSELSAAEPAAGAAAAAPPAGRAVSAGAQLGRLQSDMAWISTDLANYVRVRVAQIESGAAAGDAGGALDDRGGGGGGGSELSRLARTHSRARRGLGSELGRDDDDDDDADSDDADLDERSTAAAEAAAAEAAEAAEAAAAAAARARAPVKLSDRIPLHARGTRAPHAATRGLVARLARTHTPSAPDEGSSDSAASSDAESAGESAGGDRGLTLLATRGRALGLTAVRAALVQRYARSAWRLPAKLDEVSATQTQTQRQPPTRPRRSDAASQDSAASSPATQPRDRALSRLHALSAALSTSERRGARRMAQRAAERGETTHAAAAHGESDDDHDDDDGDGAATPRTTPSTGRHVTHPYTSVTAARGVRAHDVRATPTLATPRARRRRSAWEEADGDGDSGDDHDDAFRSARRTLLHSMRKHFVASSLASSAEATPLARPALRSAAALSRPRSPPAPRRQLQLEPAQPPPAARHGGARSREASPEPRARSPASAREQMARHAARDSALRRNLHARAGAPSAWASPGRGRSLEQRSRPSYDSEQHGAAGRAGYVLERRFTSGGRAALPATSVDLRYFATPASAQRAGASRRAAVAVLRAHVDAILPRPALHAGGGGGGGGGGAHGRTRARSRPASPRSPSAARSRASSPGEPLRAPARRRAAAFEKATSGQLQQLHDQLGLALGRRRAADAGAARQRSPRRPQAQRAWRPGGPGGHDVVQLYL